MTTNFIVSPYAISFDSILSELSTYVQSKPASEAWVDFYSSSAGQTVLELCAALGAMYSYQFILGRRESYLATAQNYSSIVGLSQSLGYSVYRGSNVKVTLHFVANQTQALQKWTIVGTYNEYDVVTIDDLTVMEAGKPCEMNVVIGNFLQETKTLDTARVTQLIYTTPTISQDYRLLLNDIEVPTSETVKDAIDDYYVCITNVYGGVDIFYLQEGYYRYSTGDQLHLQFIETNTLTYGDVSADNFDIDYATSMDYIELYQEKQEKETADSAKVKAPIHHETAMVIRARNDYSKLLLASDPHLVSTSNRDVYPGLIELTYIKADNTFMTEIEKIEWLNKIEQYSPAGVARAIISDPIFTRRTLNITLSVLKNADKIFNMTTLSPQIDEIVAAYENVLGVEIDFAQMEYEIERLDGVRTARVSIDAPPWEPNKYYTLAELCVPTDPLATNSYATNEFIYTSGSDKNFIVGDENGTPVLGEEGAFQYTSDFPYRYTDTIIDNNLIWKRVDSYEGVTIYNWDANKEYSLHDYIKEYSRGVLCVYEVIGFTKQCSSATSAWEETETTIYDGPIVWTKSEKLDNDENVYEDWKASFYYKVGDVIEHEGQLLTCTEMRAKSGAEEPEWTTLTGTTTQDNEILWMAGENPINSIYTLWNQYAVFDKNIVITNE